jgi:hypothetical protein
VYRPEIPKNQEHCLSHDLTHSASTQAQTSSYERRILATSIMTIS